MSVYKTVSNYYVGILDFLQEKIEQYKSLDNYFNSMTPDMKKELLVKICDCLIRINMLFLATEKYWLSKRKEQHALFAIFITIAVIIACMFYGILWMRIKREFTYKNADNSMNVDKVSKSFLTYSTVYMVILTVFVIIIKNAKKTMTLFEKEAAKARREGDFYIKYMFDSSVNNIEKTLFQLAIAARGSLYAADQIDASDDDLAIIGCPAPSAKIKKELNISSFYNCTTRAVDYIAAYDAVNPDLQNTLKTFYNNGQRYNTIRDIYILSGPVPMMKETNRIVNSYYDLTLKDRNGKTDTPSNDDQTKIILNKTLIKPISTILYHDASQSDPESYTKSMGNTQFAQDYASLKKLFVYNAAYSFQIYSQTLETDSKFDSNIFKYLPSQSSDLNIKNFYANISLNTLKNYMGVDPTDVPQIQEALDNSCIDTINIFKQLYGSLLSNVQGDNYFLFNKILVQNNIMSDLSTVPGFNESYITRIKEIMYTFIVSPLESQLDTDFTKLDGSIESISLALSAYNITLPKYNDYIVGEITRGSDGQKTDVINDALGRIYKSVTMKRQLKAKKMVASDKYMDQNDFNETIDKLKYNQLKSMIETPHLSFIIDSFYKKIGDSISRNDATLDNIYYSADKNYDLWKTCLIMTIVTVALILCNNCLTQVQIIPYLYTGLTDKIPDMEKVLSKLRSDANSLPAGPGKDNAQAKFKSAKYELELLYREKRNRSVNWTIRLIIPIFVGIFVVSLLYGIYKKSMATHKFNVDMIENNTFTLNNAASDLDSKMSALDLIISNDQRTQKIGDLHSITDNHKHQLYEDLKIVIDKYERCNFVLEAQKSKLPFPYTDILMSGFMIAVTLITFFMIYGQLNPIGRLKNIKHLNKLRAETEIADKAGARAILKELETQIMCHDDDIDAVVFTLKVVFFIFIVTFLIFYSSKVLSSSGEYALGLYNSNYYDDSSCVPSL